MKLPEELKTTDQFGTVQLEALVRDCAAVCRNFNSHIDFPQAKQFAQAILRRYGLEEKK